MPGGPENPGATEESSAPGARSRGATRPARLYGAYLFDLDGTIYLGDTLLPGAVELIAALRRRQRRILFLSNNPTRDPDAYAHKLSGLGIPTAPHEVLNTVTTTVRWLRERCPGATVFPIAEAPLLRALHDAGIRVSEDPAEIDVVIASYDRTFDYRKLQIAFDALWPGPPRPAERPPARLIATNPDRYCPVSGGRGEPDAAAIVAAIEACTGVRCEAVLGKPDPYVVACALEALGAPAIAAADCIMTGDRLYTDVRMALDAGMPAALVLTGETTPALLDATPADARPHFVLERIDHLLPPNENA